MIRRVTIATANGPREREARVEGPLALLLDEPHTVTHVPTGRCIWSPLCLFEASRFFELLTWRRLDWDFTDPAQVPETTQAGVRDALREIGAI